MAHTRTHRHTHAEREREGDRERETEREAEERGCRRPLKLERIQGREEENFGLMSGVLPFHGDAAEYENDPRVREAIVPVLRAAQRELDVMDDPREVQRLVVRRALVSGFGITATDRNELKAMWQYRMMQRLYKREEKTDFGRKSRAFSGKVTRDLSQGRLTRTDFTANWTCKRPPANRASRRLPAETEECSSECRPSCVYGDWQEPQWLTSCCQA